MTSNLTQKKGMENIKKGYSFILRKPLEPTQTNFINHF